MGKRGTANQEPYLASGLSDMLGCKIWDFVSEDSAIDASLAAPVDGLAVVGSEDDLFSRSGKQGAFAGVSIQRQE